MLLLRRSCSQMVTSAVLTVVRVKVVRPRGGQEVAVVRRALDPSLKNVFSPFPANALLFKRLWQAFTGLSNVWRQDT